MESPTAYRKGLLPYKLLLLLIGITFMLTWLPFLRCLMDGKTYTWGMTYFGRQFSSAGLSADYFFLILQMAFFAALFYSFFWVKNRTVFYALVGLWFLNTLGNFLFTIIQEGDTEFHGNTLNVHINLSTIILILSAIALALIAWTIIKDRQQPPSAIPWSRRNRLWALILLAPLPLQWLLFATGTPHGTTDEIGVVIAIAQSLLLPFVFLPNNTATS